MAENDIIVRIRAEGSEAFISKVKEAGGVVEDVGEKADKSSQKISASFKKIGLAAAAAFSTAAIVNFAKESARLADQQLKVEAKLLSALKGREGIQKSLIKQAKELQSTTTFGDEEIIAQQAYLASLKFTEEQIKKIIKASVDLSAGANISLDSAVRNLAKTYSGLSGELGELIPQLRGLTQEQLRAGQGVEVITELYKGQAEVLRTTGLGAVKSLQNAVGDLKEEFGKGITEGVTPLAIGLQKIAENEAVIGFFGRLGKAIGNIVGVAGAVVSSIGDILGLIPGIGKKIDELEDKLPDAGQAILDSFQPVGDEILSLEDKIRQFLDNTAQFTVEDLKAVSETIRSNLTKATEEYNKALKDNNEVIQDLTSGRIALFNSALLQISNTLKGVSGDAGDAEKTLFQFFNALRGIPNQINAVAGDINTGPGAGGLIQSILVGNGDLDETLAIPENFADLVKTSYDEAKKVRDRANQEELDEQRKQQDAIRKIKLDKAAQGIAGVAQLQQAAFTGILGNIQNELAALDSQYSQKLISEKRYQEQRAALLEKQAKANKANAIFSATIGAAAAIVQALNSPPPASFIFAALAGTIAAAQIATIAAQPVPQFAKGTKGQKKAPAGFALVGEEGPELVQMKGGEKVITAKDSEVIMKALAGYGIPVQFKPTEQRLNKPMKRLDAIMKENGIDIDWNPLLMSNEKSRYSLGRKLDKIHDALLSTHQRKMTRA